MLVEQNQQLRQALDAALAELCQQRAAELAAAANGSLTGRLPADAAVVDLQHQLDDVRAELHTASADLAALRTLNQRLLIENSRLLDA
jgi:hypothetical protein